jgi:CelD/BcsL family acetyltransferase involved in cellulose biosynthesis
LGEAIGKSAAMRVESTHPRKLTDGDIAVWRALLRADTRLSSPYLTPDWAQLVGRHRNDVRVAIWRDDHGAPLAFLPVQGTGAAMPAGGPVCDYQALVASPDADIDLSLAVKALGASRIDLTAGLQDNALGACLLTRDAGHVASFADGWDAWCAERHAAGSKVVARARKRLARLTRDSESVVFEPFSTDAAAFETLLTWKREQMQRTGVTDIFQHAWIDGLVRASFAHPSTDPNFGGAMFVLRVGGKPAAIQYCLRAGRTLHAWFVAYDTKLADHSPGLILFVESIKAAAEAGYAEMDLGPGNYQFKESLANASRPVGAGFIGGPGLSSAFKAAQFQMRALVESLPVGRARHWPAKAMRRLDVARGLVVPAGRAA